MKYYIIAGEASGDLHASNLMKALKALDLQADFRYWGGDLMAGQGGVLVKHYRDLAFMGFLEVVMNLRTVAGNLKRCKRDILEYNPDVLVLVDYPGFNLRMAEFAHKAGFRVFYYISPQVWAWNQSRVKKIRKYVDHMFVILPFEKDFYKKYGYEVDFVGHPLLDALDDRSARPDAGLIRQKYNLDDRPLVALLPGSRTQEISRMLPVMAEAAMHFSGYQFVVAAARSVPPEFYAKLCGNAPIKVLSGDTYALLRIAEAALVTSGTATLETALLEVPEVVCYKGSYLSYQIARRLIQVKYISLPNLVMNSLVVKELIQNDFTAAHLKEELARILDDQSFREDMLLKYRQLKEKLGGAGASRKAADHMISYLKKTEVKASNPV